MASSERNIIFVQVYVLPHLWISAGYHLLETFAFFDVLVSDFLYVFAFVVLIHFVADNLDADSEVVPRGRTKPLSCSRRFLGAIGSDEDIAVSGYPHQIIPQKFISFPRLRALSLCFLRLTVLYIRMMERGRDFVAGVRE